MIVTARDIEVIQQQSQISSIKMEAATRFGWLEKRKDGTLKNNLERLEFEEKAKRLGIKVPWK
jgi:hypothetical protein